MTNFRRVFAAASGLLLATMTTAAGTQRAPAQKVVFLGDATTYDWGQPANSSVFQGNPKWINKGLTGKQTSAAMLARFQSDVVSEKPAIVHILAGAVDVNLEDDANRAVLVEEFEANVMAMVAEAGHANIKVILGTIPPQLIATSTSSPQVWQVFEPQLIQNINAWLESYGSENHIPVINYHDVLCGCVGSTNPGPSGEYPMMASNGSTPSPAGYALMSPLVSLAIASYNLTMQRGYVQAPNDSTQVEEGNSLALTAYGVYSDGIPRPMLNTNFAGEAGTWSSSNPSVLYVGYNGVAQALAPGQSTITFTSLTGLAFTPLTVTVTAAQP